MTQLMKFQSIKRQKFKVHGLFDFPPPANFSIFHRTSNKFFLIFANQIRQIRSSMSTRMTFWISSSLTLRLFIGKYFGSLITFYSGAGESRFTTIKNLWNETLKYIRRKSVGLRNGFIRERREMARERKMKLNSFAEINLLKIKWKAS